MVQSGGDDKSAHENNSTYLARKLGHDYSFLSNLFSMTENLTIEKYMILQKTERVKELLAYGELSLSEIAFQMDYSSVAHLSAQRSEEHTSELQSLMRISYTVFCSKKKKKKYIAKHRRCN